MTLKQRATRDNLVMKSLKVHSIQHHICKTDKGDLYLKLTKDGTEADYLFVLDAVPVEKDLQKDLMVLYKVTLDGNTN